MATISDDRNKQNSGVRGPALEDFSTRARSIVSEREIRMKQGEAYFFTTYKADLGNTFNRGLIFQLLASAGCIADVTLTWRASGLCLVELIEDVSYAYEGISPFLPSFNKRRLSANTASMGIAWSEGGSLSGGSTVFQEITGAAGLSAGSFRFIPKLASPGWSLYWLKVTNTSGGDVAMDVNAQWTEYEEVR